MNTPQQDAAYWGIKSIADIVWALTNCSTFRQEYYDNDFNQPKSIEAYACGFDWSDLTDEQKHDYADYVWEVMFGEDPREAADTAFREAIGFPVGFITPSR